MTLQKILQKATEERWATGHFNASELDQIRSIIEACVEMRSPAIIGTSEGERKHLGLLEATALRDSLRHEYGIQIFLNADHSKSVDVAKAAIDVGYDSVHIDLSAKPFEENSAGTREVVDYARTKNSNISIEGELGYIRGESQVQQKKIEIKSSDYTNSQEALRFVESTGVDRLAIMVGNIHGISLDEPALDIPRIKEIRKIVSGEVALVLHAASGIPDDQIMAAIDAGIANIHINTDIRISYVKALKKSLEEHLNELAMYKLDKSAMEAMKNTVKEKLKLFGSVNKI